MSVRSSCFYPKFLLIWKYLWFCLMVTIVQSERAVAFASLSIPPPPPISMPVWSLASPSKEMPSETSMNIVTFATPVSVAPPKLWIVSLYTNTKTRNAFLESKRGVLQLLTPPMNHVVPLLGKRSGYEEGYCKKSACAALGYSWVSSEASTGRFLRTECSMDLLPGCASYILLKLLSTQEAGDHDVALCEVLATGTWDEGSQSIAVGPSTPLDSNCALYTAQLRAEGII